MRESEEKSNIIEDRGRINGVSLIYEFHIGGSEIYIFFRDLIALQNFMAAEAMLIGKLLWNCSVCKIKCKSSILIYKTT